MNMKKMGNSILQLELVSRWYIKNRQARKKIVQKSKPFFFKYNNQLATILIDQDLKNQLVDYGIAICNTNDTFDPNRGYLLALRRLLRHESHPILSGTLKNKEICELPPAFCAKEVFNYVTQINKELQDVC